MVAFPIDTESNFSAGSPDVLFEASDFLGSGGGEPLIFPQTARSS